MYFDIEVIEGCQLDGDFERVGNNGNNYFNPTKTVILGRDVILTFISCPGVGSKFDSGVPLKCQNLLGLPLSPWGLILIGACSKR